MPRLRPPQMGRQAAAVVAEPEDDIELEQARAEPEEVVAPEPEPALKAQYEALKQSERENNARIAELIREKEEALQRAREREAEVSSLKEQTVSSQAEAIDAALSGAQSEAEAAQQEIEMAAQLGDLAAQSKAYRRLARAEASILNLENGKSAIEKQIKETPKVEPQIQQSSDPIDRLNVPPLAKQWLRRHPVYVNDPRANAKVQAVHYEVLDEGHAEYSQAYFDSLEEKLGLRQAPLKQEEAHVDNEPVSAPRKTVSAPPSREAPNASGKRESRITLSLEQKEAAKIAGITETEYAAGLIRLREEKAKGNYSGGGQ